MQNSEYTQNLSFQEDKVCNFLLEQGLDLSEVDFELTKNLSRKYSAESDKLSPSLGGDSTFVDSRDTGIEPPPNSYAASYINLIKVPQPSNLHAKSNEPYGWNAPPNTPSVSNKLSQSSGYIGSESNKDQNQPSMGSFVSKKLYGYGHLRPAYGVKPDYRSTGISPLQSPNEYTINEEYTVDATGGTKANSTDPETNRRNPKESHDSTDVFEME
ncbi:hypothetical protein BB559_001727 [Furculomyces boomerangus]|uniref:Uncharacterized protein n=1 Tax=Furculomyces boomerangus TaxID=61424 RepID=A0A2T9Z0X4_9FUNG|nr:hypothetical protein BB559_001727 [Furculomyces boomerangus]